MLTGDSLSVANEVAKDSGIEGRIIRGPELREIESSSTKKAAQVSEQSGVFAEIYPEDVGMSYLGLTGDTGLHTFVFDMLIFGSMFTILTVREKGYFWESFPSKTLVIAICGDFVMTFLISYFGIPGLVPIPAEYILIAIIWYLTFALVVNDIVKVNILRHRKVNKIHK
ncbi:MAG: H+-transporting ATPase [Euryarchaeota archaeon]|nr:H+-transporting ATPase [Euryarchaeota archaeon]